MMFYQNYVLINSDHLSDQLYAGVGGRLTMTLECLCVRLLDSLQW